MNDNIFDLTKKLRHELLKKIPDEGSPKTKPEMILLNALILYEKKRKSPAYVNYKNFIKEKEKPLKKKLKDFTDSLVNGEDKTEKEGEE